VNIKTMCVVLLMVFVIGCGYGSKYNPPMSNGGSTPNIKTLMPNSATHSTPGFLLTINGSGFTSGSVVYWNMVVHNPMSVMTNQITVQISASDIATAGTIKVYVRSSGGVYGNGVNSNTVTFTVM
jgi:hypothetical protein